MEQNKNEVEVDLKEILFLLLDKIYIIIAATVCVGLIALVYTKTLVVPMYRSDTSMYVMNKESGTNITYSDLQVSSQLTTDYLNIVTSRTVLERVIENLELELSVGELKGRITVSSPTNSRIIEISVLDENAVNAKKIADALAQLSGAYICEKMNTEKVNVIDVGNVPTAPDSPNVMKNTIIGALLGFVLAVAVIVIRYMLDDTIKTEEDVERHLGCSMLAAIPYVDALDDSIGKKSKRRRVIRNAESKHR